MLSSKAFIRQSLETHLFFARIMKEHAFFLQLGFTPRDANYFEQANNLRMEFDQLLWEVVCLSNCVVSCNVLESGEVVTPYTLRAENISSYLTGVTIPTYITEAEMKLMCGEYIIFDPMLEHSVSMLNQRAICLITAIIDFKTNILNNVLSCNMFTANYPLLIEHILREAKLYLSMIVRIQNREEIDVDKEIYEQELFWNRIMAEHSRFIRGLLDPTEDELIHTANDFAKEFDKLTAAVEEAIEKCLPIDKITDKSLEATKEVRDFNMQGTEGLLDCKIRSIIMPLLGDHVLRESNHFIRLLKKFQEID